MTTSVMTVGQVQANAVEALQAAAQTVMIAMAVSAMSQFVSTGMAMSAGMTAASVSRQTTARAEYEEVNKKIFKLSFVLDRYRSSVVSLRERRSELAKEYKIAGAIPPLVELRRKYPMLYATVRNLKTAEEQLARLELRDILLRKRRKELARVLGIVEEQEIPKHVQYTRMKKFVPKTGIY